MSARGNNGREHVPINGDPDAATGWRRRLSPDLQASDLFDTTPRGKLLQVLIEAFDLVDAVPEVDAVGDLLLITRHGEIQTVDSGPEQRDIVPEIKRHFALAAAVGQIALVEGQPQAVQLWGVDTHDVSVLAVTTLAIATTRDWYFERRPLADAQALAAISERARLLCIAATWVAALDSVRTEVGDADPARSIPNTD